MFILICLRFARLARVYRNPKLVTRAFRFFQNLALLSIYRLFPKLLAQCILSGITLLGEREAVIKYFSFEHRQF